MITLTTVRHATTANAVRRVISGRLDEPLSGEGIREAEGYVREFGRLRANVTLSSPLLRAVQTARIVTGCTDDAVLPLETAIDRDYGKLQGIPPAEVAKLATQITYVEAGGIRHSLNPPGGETLDDVRGRAQLTWDAIVAAGAPHVILVSHQALLQQLHGVLMGRAVVDAMGHDIVVLQIDRFVVDDDDELACSHTQVFGGSRSVVSW